MTLPQLLKEAMDAQEPRARAKRLDGLPPAEQEARLDFSQDELLGMARRRQEELRLLVQWRAVGEPWGVA